MLFSVPKSLAFLLAMCSMVGPLSANTYMPGLGLIAEEFAVSEVAAYQTLSSYLMCILVAFCRSNFRQSRPTSGHDGRTFFLQSFVLNLCHQFQL